MDKLGRRKAIKKDFSKKKKKEGKQRRGGISSKGKKTSGRRRPVQRKRPLVMGPRLSRTLLEELNKFREFMGLHRLKWDHQLYELAVWWAKRMYTEGWFGHTDPKTGEMLFEKERMVVADCLCMIPNKNHRPSYKGGMKALQAWFESNKGHREILLIPDEKFKGAAIGAYGNIYVFLVTTYELYLPPDVR